MKMPKIGRLDHHGIVGGVIDELGMVRIIDDIIGRDEQELVSAGMGVKAMIMNGLGFSDRPLSLSPQFFSNLPMSHLFGKGVRAEHFNRHKLGRVLDSIHKSGSEELFSAVVSKAVHLEGIAQSVRSLDTTSFSFFGDYEVSDREENAEVEADEGLREIRITHGYSKAHRPDLKQVVMELVVSQDGGIPLFMKAHDGNASDNKIFRERVKAMVEGMKSGEPMGTLIADSKLYTKAAMPWLAQVEFITRVPSSNKKVRQVTETALSKADDWKALVEGYKGQRFEVEHNDVTQRWVVIHSEAALLGARKTVHKQALKELDVFKRKLKHLCADSFSCASDAEKALRTLQKKLKLVKVRDSTIYSKNHYRKRGKPSADTPVDRVSWHIRACCDIDEQKLESNIRRRATFVLATNIDPAKQSDSQVLEAYKSQSAVERGFRFLKEPSFFTAAFFLKKPARIEALMVIMTLSLLVYSIAQRRLREALSQSKKTVPNQINKPISNPTLRWVFQLFQGINLLEIQGHDGEMKFIVDGLNQVRSTIVNLLGGEILRLYSNYSSQGCST